MTILATRDDTLGDLLAAPSPLGFGDLVRYDHMRSRWLIWNGVRWRPDRERRVFDMVREQVQLWWVACEEGVAADSTGDEASQMCALMTDAGWLKTGRGEFRKTMLPAFDTGKKEGILRGLSAREGIAMAGDEWDLDPYLVGFDNGIVDLKKGTFYEHPDPAMLVSKTVGCDYDNTVGFPEDRPFSWFLSDIMGGDESLVAYLRRMMGYFLLGLQQEQKFWLWVGRGSNGKGVLAKTIANVLGDYADTPSDSLYMRTKFGTAASSSARPDLMRLQGLRFTYMSEPPGGQFNESLLKAHTGEDMILARDLYAKSEQMAKFPPTHKIVFLTNDPPKTDDVGVSMRRRVRVIQFQRDYSLHPDLGLETHLQTQKQAILNLMIFEAIQWLAKGISEPKLISDWSDDYISDNDPLAQFIEDRCVIEYSAKGSSVSLYGAYEEWCHEQQMECQSRIGFGMAMSHKFTKEHARTGAIYRGVRVLNAMEKAMKDVAEGRVEAE